MPAHFPQQKGSRDRRKEAIGTMPMLQIAFRAILASLLIYLGFTGILTIPFFQNHIIYLHGVTLTWFQDVNFPERWGFLHNQVTPFYLKTSDGETLHAWHILPLGQYQLHEQRLLAEPSGPATDITARLSFKLLRDNPNALLVLYFHGAAGTLASGYRPLSYRALYAAAPDRIHTLAIDYRGFGQSTGTPSEAGLLTDAKTLATWAMKTADIPPERIVLFGQSMGTAVAVSLAHHLALDKERAESPVLFAGMVLVAPMADVRTLTATYRVAGTIPILSPIAALPGVLDLLNRFILSKWPSKDKIAEFVSWCETRREGKEPARYHINLIHAEDDYDIPWEHSEIVYWHAVNASTPHGISFEELQKDNEASRISLGAGGWSVQRQTEVGHLREDILKHGLHDVIMSYPVLSLAVLRAFQSVKDETHS